MRLSGLSAAFRADGVCVIRERGVLGGALALAFAAAAGYPLILRPELYDGPPEYLWLFRVLFCGGFGLLGLIGVTHRLEARFDPSAGTFAYLSRSLFSKKSIEGPLRAIRCVRLGVRTTSGSTLRDHFCFERSTYNLSLVFEGREWPLLTARVEPVNPRRHNTVDGMLPEELAQRLARLIGCPLEKVEK